MPDLTDDERELIIRTIADKKPLGREWLEKLFPPEGNGEFLWRGKALSLAKTASFLDSLPKSDDAGVAPRQRKLPHGWSALLFKGDNLTFLQNLLAESNAFGMTPSPFSLIYIDPPFFVGTDFHARVPRAGRVKGASPEQNPDEEKEIFAYSDTWKGGKSQYFSMLYERIALMRALLSPAGLLCVHCDWRAVAGVRFILDECFGPENFVNEIIWHYTGGGRSKQYFSRKHDSILVYAKGKGWTFNIDAVRVPYKKTSGYAKAGIVSKSGKRYMPHPKGTPLDSVWDIPMVNPMAKERVAYATQKPLSLLERIISAFSNEGDLIGDFFCGSGTTLLAGLGLGRRVVGCDFGEQAVSVSRERLLAHGLLSLEVNWNNASSLHVFLES